MVVAAFSMSAQTIDIRMSVKVIRHPTTGVRPLGISNGMFYAAADNANVWKATYYRGYRFRITEIVDIGGPTQGGTNGPSKWYGSDPRNYPEPWLTFQNDINTDARYQRRTDQVNFYITTGPSSDPGGACPIPPGETSYIACHGFVNDGPWWLNHELGHFFGLSHTHAGASGCTPGDDGISDTLLDTTCWTSRDQVANYHYAAPYANLNAGQRFAVDNVYFNVMSYHEALNKDTVENRMTELQLDREADIANNERAPFVTGKTRFVSTSGSDGAAGSSTGPYRTVLKGVSVANNGGGDIILLRPGNYNETPTINKPVTLRATRNGWATIGQ
jgi:hypothetical protein